MNCLLYYFIIFYSCICNIYIRSIYVCICLFYIKFTYN